MRRPRFIVEAVRLMACDTSEGKVRLGGLDQYLKRTEPAFSPQVYGHSGQLEMLRTYDFLTVQQEIGGHWSVRLNQKADDGDTSVGQTMASLNTQILKCLNVRVPTLNEQIAIAAALSDMDAELTTFEARRDKISALKQGMMQELLTGRTRLV
jgi:hypothetical protein